MNTNNFDFNNLGNSIRHLVDDAVNSQNFKELNQTINSTINHALHGVDKTIDNLNHTYENRTKTPSVQKQMSPALYNKSSGKQVAASLQIVFGFILAGIGGIAALVLGILAISGILKSGIIIALVLMCLLLTGGLILGFFGTRSLSRVKRFHQYCKVIGNRTYIELEELEKLTGYSKKLLIQDLEEMIATRMFCQAHLDQQQTCLMLTNEVFLQYLETMRNLEARKKEDQALADAGFSPEFRAVIRESETYISKIRRANDELPGEIISRKLDRLELVISRILYEVKKQPKKASDLQKFMNYYLPTTWKLINAYLDFEKQPVQTENTISTCKEIEQTLDTINNAFEKLLNDLFQSQAWDISSDISVLHTILAQEGLTQGGMN